MTVAPKRFMFAMRMHTIVLFAERNEKLIFMSSFELGTISLAENMMPYHIMVCL
jgi:hypothetical protein